MIDFRTYQPTADALKDRVILVTGASQGVGKEAALCLAKHGATVVLLGRHVKKLEAVYDAIEANGGPKPAAVAIDLERATEAELANVATQIQSQLGRLDGILHNASAFVGLFPLEQEPMEYFMTHLRVNVVAPAALTRACLPLLRASGDGSVVLVGESHGLKASPYWGSFSISRAAAMFYAQIAASEWDAAHDPRVNIVVPGPIHCPQRTKTHPGEVRESLPQPAQLMPIYLYLLGADSKGVTGQTFQCAEWLTVQA
ncbi:NAD(P)-dependent dehydrogenase (short-subunit alcohol dehydrogenase family) [Chitinivorax tropicus]|uniref:NAD(P)-dependent dehydrogenase (Short-subunit alcohol dehydrogenase family) n=1 Tax=Chitinivorax tropicus TaxID=714531 RepID=A0A840MNC0_9PROT|nr:SDR family NAD(P)-dependent oxidoreductase [Chitinivorax tropicus]MBB5018477.1 NAD(P)-dependent dehydrogenase (short-subunit alcohol dehydrogenase family) [Chitinivorax tropicus]